MRELPLPVVLLSLALGACNDEPTGFSEVAAELVVEPAVVDWGRVPLEVEATRRLTVRNQGNALLVLDRIAIETEQPVEGLSLLDGSVFRIDHRAADRLAPGASLEFDVIARPTELRTYQARLVVRSNSGEAESTLRVEGAPQPRCEDQNPCTTSRFEPSVNECVVEFVDGQPCQPADLCIINGVCSQGVCLGESKSCEDDSICTRDLCRQSDGMCFFPEDLSQCDDGNPCTIDGCGPDGCTHEPALNGSSCDDDNACTTNDACFGGECIGTPLSDGMRCDDGDSCTVNETCVEGDCVGTDIVQDAEEGEVIFTYRLPSDGFARAFLHRREMSLSADGVLVGLDHRSFVGGGFEHVVVGVSQCGTRAFEYGYTPSDGNAFVRYVRRAMQIDAQGRIQVIVGVRQLPENGYRPETTSFELNPDGSLCERVDGDDCRTGPRVRVPGGETGWSLTPDGSLITGVVMNPVDPLDVSRDQFSLLREDREGNLLWRHTRSTRDWAEFLGVAGPRVLFWSGGRFGALDFGTGQQVWSRDTPFIPKEMALSTELNLGVARSGSQVIGVALLSGDERFRYPEPAQLEYVPRTDPVISSDGRILLMMERRDDFGDPVALEWVELDLDGQVLTTTMLPYSFPPDPDTARHEDFFDDPYPTVADDGVTYVGYGDQFWALDPGGAIRWTLTSTVNGFTGTVPLLREDGVLLLSTTSREIVGIKTNGGQMDTEAWSSFRNDPRRSNHTP